MEGAITGGVSMSPGVAVPVAKISGVGAEPTMGIAPKVVNVLDGPKPEIVPSIPEGSKPFKITAGDKTSHDTEAERNAQEAEHIIEMAKTEGVDAALESLTKPQEDIPDSGEEVVSEREEITESTEIAESTEDTESANPLNIKDFERIGSIDSEMEKMNLISARLSQMAIDDISLRAQLESGNIDPAYIKQALSEILEKEKEEGNEENVGLFSILVAFITAFFKGTFKESGGAMMGEVKQVSHAH